MAEETTALTELLAPATTRAHAMVADEVASWFCTSWLRLEQGNNVQNKLCVSDVLGVLGVLYFPDSYVVLGRGFFLPVRPR